ncbi:hypothetical protein PBAL39_03509 [Pedobacter sp. BAL39]|uniref:DUF4983 domain-containing protein n=1 Tax=Pedobacter sp. BAL39 TaxID=391596 RepID=UPI000155A13B|nr:LamG-like jellyroll fold domain-containing protein [Pedobacter sp. BAL39]EDM35577.1 hypothetical protein PBAL39_03509 [Pedobacter sp. BAL39]
MKRNQDYIYLGLLVCLLTTVFGCNKDFETKLSEERDIDSVSVIYGDPKVILLVVDGARGTSVRDAKTPVITGMLPHSIYSWTSLADEENPQAGTNWADLLTGVRKSKHGVIGNDFSANKFEAYPLIFSRIKAANPRTKIVSYASSALFNEQLSEDVDEHAALGTDVAVKSAIVTALQTDTASFIVGQFKDVDAAGAAEGYDVSKPGYKAAINTFDSQLGEVLTALKSRPNYASENWLVVIASNNGGKYTLPAEENDNTIFSNTEVNTFSVIYNPQYKTRFITKPFLGNRFGGKGVRLYGKDNSLVNATVDEAALFNFGDTTQFTIEMKVKKNSGPRGNYRFTYPSILGKRQEWSSNWAGNGWTIFLENSSWQFNIRGTGNSGAQVLGGALSNGNWNSVAVVGVNREAKRYVRVFTDGVFNRELEITSFGNINNNFPLTLGLLPGSGHNEPDVVLADVRIWRAALTDATIKQFSCDTDVSTDHPNYPYLIGFWPLTDGEGDEFRDLGPTSNSFKIHGPFQWENFNDLICGLNAETLGAAVPKNADIATQILSWMRIPTRQVWGLDGRVWLDQ